MWLYKYVLFSIWCENLKSVLLAVVFLTSHLKVLPIYAIIFLR